MQAATGNGRSMVVDMAMAMAVAVLVGSVATKMVFLFGIVFS